MKNRKYLQPQTQIISATADGEIMVNWGEGDTSTAFAKPATSEGLDGEQSSAWEE